MTAFLNFGYSFASSAGWTFRKRVDRRAISEECIFVSSKERMASKSLKSDYTPAKVHNAHVSIRPHIKFVAECLSVVLHLTDCSLVRRVSIPVWLKPPTFYLTQQTQSSAQLTWNIPLRDTIQLSGWICRPMAVMQTKSRQQQHIDSGISAIQLAQVQSEKAAMFCIRLNWADFACWEDRVAWLESIDYIL